MSFLKKVSRHNGIIAILKSHFISYNPLISLDFFLSIKAFSFIIMKKRGKKNLVKIMVGKFKMQFHKRFWPHCVSHDECFRVKSEQDISWWNIFFFNSFISTTSPSQPPILINFFFTRIVVILCEICSKNRRRPGNRFFCVYLSKEKQRIINRRLIPSFSIQKKEK